MCFVTNSSVVMESDGKPHLDSDMDGLPDDLETAWGSNPNKADTFGLGISDLSLYTLLGGAPLSQAGLPNPASGACASLNGWVPTLSLVGSGRTQ